MARILVIDDEENLCWALKKLLEREGYDVETAGTAKAGLALLDAAPPDVLLLDVRLPDADGLDVLRDLRSAGFPGEVVVITAHGNMETAVEAMHRGAFDYLAKPLDSEKARLTVQRAARAGALSREVEDLRALTRERPPGTVVGATPVMQEVFKQIGVVSLSDAPVLILGETGSGKDVAARAIHRASARREGPFVPVHCAAIPETLLEAELFGHEKGAFTGASVSREGRLRRAEGGTLFLDEVGEIPPAIQVKLLRVLEEGAVESLGADRATPLNLRFLSATNADLQAKVDEGAFREDLYFRLNVFSLSLPPLRERREDIPLLISHFLQASGAEKQEISREALNLLTSHAWPGNVRELRNAVEHAVGLARGRVILPEHLPQSLGGGAPAGDRAGDLVRDLVRRTPEGQEENLHAQVLALFERPLIEEILRQTGGNQVQASRILGIHRTTLRKKIAEYGL